MLKRIVVATTMAMAVGASPALAADRVVAKTTDVACGGSTPYHTIQSAVNASGPGDSIHVCPGLYEEQVVIGPGKDNLKLDSVNAWQAAVRFPPGVLSDPAAVVLVRQAKGVVIKAFTIEGPWTDATSCASPRHYGVRVDTGGSAKILSNHITLIEDSIAALRGCQNGVAVQVGRNADATTGSAEIAYNVIDKYQKNGPTIDNAGSFGYIHDNVMDGGGDNNIIGKNGIQIGRGAAAKVEYNRAFNHYYSGLGPPPAGDAVDDNDGTGILVFEVNGNVAVSGNTLYGNDLGFAIGTASKVLVANNTTNSNVFDGLRAESDTSGNWFLGNKSSSNGSHDCHDNSNGTGTAGTANTWKNNQGVTQNRPGLCQPTSGGHDHGRD